MFKKLFRGFALVILVLAAVAVIMTVPSFILMLVLGALAAQTGWNIALGFWAVFFGLWALGIIGRTFFGNRTATARS